MVAGTHISTLPIQLYLEERKLQPGEDIERVIADILTSQGFDGAFQVNRREGTVSKFKWSMEPDPYDYLDELGEWTDWHHSQEPISYAYYQHYETCGTSHR